MMETQSFQTPERGVLLLQGKDHLLHKIVLHFIAARILGGQMKHQLDATLCRFYFCRVTLHVSGANPHHQEYLKLIQRPPVHVLSLQVSHHISLLGPEGPNKEM